MRHSLKSLVFFTAAAASLPLLGAPAAVPNAAPTERYVAIAPCRLVDTRVMPPATPEEQAQRSVAVLASRCGSIVPGNAAAFAIRVTNLSRQAERTPGQIVTPGPVTRRPAGAPLVFPVSADQQVLVDLEGYYLPPGTPAFPGEQTATANAAAMTDAATQSTSPRSADAALRTGPGTGQRVENDIGTGGAVYVDGSYTNFSATGVLGVSNDTKPWSVLKLGDASTSGFVVFATPPDNPPVTPATNPANRNSELFRVSANGPVRLTTSSLNTYISGRSEYHESVAIANNVINEARVLNPRDANNSNASRVTFFSARSDDEQGSPALTKYQAYTVGYYSTVPDINFDSQIYYHTPGANKYHFRAYSGAESKDTFWVKPNSSADNVSGTRADMFISGNVGIGKVADAAVKLDVVGDVNVTGRITGATVIGATYQDVAEWVPASEALGAGTVVVVDPSGDNIVKASSHAYQTSVAGVVSPKPGVILGVEGPQKVKVATTGRVRVHVDASKGAIARGDLLVTSDVPGTAMKSQPLSVGGAEFHRPGTIIGKALEPLAEGSGDILVLLSLQ